MKPLLIALALVGVILAPGAIAQAPGTCESRAIDKNGKELAGAAPDELPKQM